MLARSESRKREVGLRRPISCRGSILALEAILRLTYGDADLSFGDASVGERASDRSRGGRRPRHAADLRAGYAVCIFFPDKPRCAVAKQEALSWR